MRRKQDNSYLHFTRRERNGTIVLLFIILMLILIPFVYPFFYKEKPLVNDKYAGDIAKLKISYTENSHKKYNTNGKDYPNYSYPKKEYSKDIHGELFYFDPNTLSASGWKKLGVKEKTISTIQNYISKGGKFREANDIKKIWGLQARLADRLIPFVKISDPGSDKYSSTTEYEKKLYPVKKSSQPIDINDADSSEFTDLPGIGAKLSQRIINYRNKLGGFYTADQVAETYGLPDSTFKKIRPLLNIGKNNLKLLNINLATLEELKIHPYIRYHLANVIIQYRMQHGKYTSVNDLKNIMLMNDSIYKKISPYLVVD